MDKIVLLPEDSHYYKANLHAHTVISDGRFTPEELKKEYQKKGYSIVAYTDHNKYADHQDLTDENFLAINAYEVNINDFPKIPNDFSQLKTYHINLYDTDPQNRPEAEKVETLPERRYSDIEYINGYIAQMKEKGFIACYNHPYWSLQNYDDYKDLRGCFAMEIYNYGCEIDGMYGYNPQSYDEMLRTGSRLYCVATDDNHNVYPLDNPMCDSFGGFTMVYAKELTYPAIIDALKKGHFYSSMGPEIYSLSVEDKKVTVKCSPAKMIYLKTEGRNCSYAVAEPGKPLTEAVLPFTGKEGAYFRVEIRDEKGYYAATNAYFMDDLFIK